VEDSDKPSFGVVAPIAGVGLVAATTRRDEEREEDGRPDASALLTEQAGHWSTPATSPTSRTAGDHVPVVGADERGGESADWDDTDDTWWLTGDNPDDERNDDA
jgi:hypothetical protein